MGDFERTVREFKRTLTGGRQKTAPLDIMGKVTRVEDGVAWVRFAGSEVGDTPVRMNIDCKEGDDVQVRSSGGKAWIVGNQSAPLIPVWAAIPVIAVLSYICCAVTTKIISLLPGSKWIVGKC